MVLKYQFSNDEILNKQHNIPSDNHFHFCKYAKIKIKMSDSKKYCNLKCDINSKYQCHSPNKLNKQINVNKMVVTFDNSKFLQVTLICPAFTISCFYNKLQIGCLKFS